jgi:hypothetical protein
MLRPDAADRLAYALGRPRAEMEAFLLARQERREFLAEIVRRDERENAEFYRMLGER